ncbi:MAG: histidine kinase [Vicinamibacterales bacterium]|nr:histidine kinase [Vicinamibacterales bacterium]
MTPRTARILLVVAAFALMTTVTLTEQFLTYENAAPPPPPAPKAAAPQPPASSMLKPFPVLFWSGFRYFLAWALVAPGIFWLSRAVPVARRRWWWPALFHVLVPIAAAIPFFTFRLVFTAALAWRVPPLYVVPEMWWKILSMESIAIAPTYWVLIGAGSLLQFYRDDEARQVRTIELQRALSAAQLDGLRMKLQPHFLFNTLNAMGALAREGDTDDVVRMVDHLGTLLRLSMETSGRQLATLDDELRLLDAYLAIEEVRHKDRLRVSRRIDASTGVALVPNLILQPLVENAIAHGLGGRIDARTVEIAARRDHLWLEVSIRDDGPGLPDGWTLQRGSGRGLKNVQERLAALYGDDARLSVENAPGGGTIARLRLPLTTQPAPGGGSR